MKLPYSSYTCNRSTFEDFLEVDGEMIAVVANPMHHTNSTVRLANEVVLAPILEYAAVWDIYA